MTSNTPTPPKPGPSGRPPQQQSNAAGVAIDPMKLLHKYKFVLVASLFIGVITGTAAHFLFAEFAPKYTAHIMFECAPAEDSVEVISVSQVDETEMERFIGTQVVNMKSQKTLSKVITDPRLQQLAPEWSKDYLRRGNIDIVNAFKDFEKMVKATSIPKTFLVKLAVTTGDKNDAAGLVTMVKDAYLSDLDSAYKSDIVSRRRAIRDSLQTSNTELATLADRKARIVREGRIDSIESDQSTAAAQLRLVNAELLNIQQSLEALTVIRMNDEAQLQRDTGIEYDSSLRAAIDESPMIMTFKQELKRLQTALVSLQADGIKPDHRQYRQIVNQISAHNRKIEDTREELLRDAFEARVQNTATTLQQFRAQEAELSTQKDDLVEKLTELTRLSEEIADIDRQIEANIKLMGDQQTALSELMAASTLSSAQRVTVVESATVPDLPTFPVIYIMIPAGVFLVVSLTAGVIVLNEILDQRIKSVSDIRMIPRTPSLGIVMDSSEDPSNPANVATAFADDPGSVFAEHFRHLRTAVSSALNKNGHQTLVVVGAMPKSGATTVITNLAQSCVASGISTLIIDANFRRPSVHKSLELGEGNGLGDVLAGDSSLESCIVDIDRGPSVLRVGTKENRQVERLSSKSMKELLGECKSKYDLVLIDVAPSIVAGDATILANSTDASMLVVRAMSEKRGQVARMSRELGDSRAEFIGVLVNGVRSAAGGYMRKNIKTSFNYRTVEETPKANPKDSAA